VSRLHDGVVRTVGTRGKLTLYELDRASEIGCARSASRSVTGSTLPGDDREGADVEDALGLDYRPAGKTEVAAGDAGDGAAASPVVKSLTRQGEAQKSSG